jgi:mannose-6-phosphate isomerase-like protein (cupin superfamily)
MISEIINKPWGSETIWARTDKYVGKLLYINNGHRLSLQYHNIKDESMRVLKGILTFVLDNKTFILNEGENIHVLPGQIHRMEANDGDVTIIEVSTSELNDIVRLDDDYLRA